jgi:hypothetical protein
MRARTFWGWVFAAGVLLPAPSAAVIGPPLDVKDLIGRADLIVVGEVQRIRKNPQKETYQLGNLTVEATRFVATLSVDQVLKGDKGVTSVDCTYLVPDTKTFVGVRRLEEKSYRLVFLKRDGSAWEVVSRAYPSLPAVSINSVPSTGVSQAVGHALAAVIDSAAVGFDQKQLALEALATVDGIDLRSLLSGALTDSNADLRLSAAATLMRAGDASGLLIAEKVLLARDPGASKAVLAQAAAAVSETGRDVNALPALGRLLKAPDIRTRQSAAMALRAARSPAAVQSLVLALNDEDLEVQYSAVMGLAELTKDWPHAPAFDVFRRSPTVFVDYWKRRELNHIK